LSGDVSRTSRSLTFAGTGIAVVGFLLQQRSPRHLSLPLLASVERLLAAVTVGSAADDARVEVLRHLVLDLRLWSAAPTSVQRKLFDRILRLVKVRAVVVVATGELAALLKACGCARISAAW
jgi:Domain of unknown function (DUF4704)